MKEYVWFQSIKWIPGMEYKYAVTVDGNIATYRFGRCRWMKLHVGKNGYLQCYINGRLRHVHDLILSTWCGQRPIGFLGCHINNNKLCNHIYNLRWDTQRGNRWDRKGHHGVYFDKKRHRYYACINLGYFGNLQDALLSYNESALKLFGNSARLNKVD